MKFMKMAHGISHQAEHKTKTYKLGCIVVRGGAVVSKGVNKGYNHAEARALRKHMCYEGCVLYVARINGKISKPCLDCYQKIVEAGISMIVYVDKNGDITKELVVRDKEDIPRTNFRKKDNWGQKTKSSVPM